MTSHRTFCSVDSCDSLRENISFFRFPKDATRCQQWKKAFGFVGDHKYANLTPEQAYIRIRVCRKRFDDESFTSSGKHLLTTAVPLKFPTKLDGND
ncbi:52 kDa repressor of the inhibitor of the protein kinase-like [Leptinotarsa decemlineata]|uniref:52 kDa repressor of the inhibitor of the protein kinase-like n=1 Tax=Leptinotarsa decemlineata TaxID=7539 RepID=UPI003D305354